MGCRELYRNDIIRKISKELGNLKNLVSMDLYENGFQFWFCKLCKLCPLMVCDLLNFDL
jgi:hypothetical protein